MVTIIANQLDSNYSQTQINAFYTQCKKLIENPFDFVVFVQDDEMDLLCSTKKMDGYIDGISFHVPKYGRDWLEIDIMQYSKPNSPTLFITPNIILNNIKDIETYKSNKKIILASCHYDIMEWLQPDWIYSPSRGVLEKKSSGRSHLSNYELVESNQKLGTCSKNIII